MWAPNAREQHSRKALRYQSDLTDAEWAVIAPHLPPVHRTGRPRSWPMCEIINGTFCVMHAGCPWRLLPSDFPPWETIYRCFAAFRDEARFEKINHTLVMMDRERVGREASPSFFHRDPPFVEEPPERSETGAHAALLGQTVAHLAERYVHRLFNQAKQAGLMRIEFGADWVPLPTRDPLTSFTRPSHPPDRCGYTNPEPRRRPRRADDPASAASNTRLRRSLV